MYECGKINKNALIMVANSLTKVSKFLQHKIRILTTKCYIIGGDGGDNRTKLIERLKKELGVDVGARIEEDKKSPKARQFQKPCPASKSEWESALDDFKKIQAGHEKPLGK